MQGHWHQPYVMNNAGAATAWQVIVNTGGVNKAGASSQIRDPVADLTNGTPRTGPNTEPDSTTVYRAMWVGTIL